MQWRLLLVSAVLAACGPSAKEVREANRAVYETEFAVVWAAVTSAVKEEYSRLAVEDPIGGRIVTDWHLIERGSDNDISGATNTPGGGQGTPGLSTGGLPTYAGTFFRLDVKIKPGGPPWRVVVDGEAAQYTPGMAMIQPFSHSDADEPPWVKTRIEKIRVKVHKKLAAHARLVEEKQKTTEIETGPWEGLPEGAPAAVAEIHAAAKKKDVARLRRLMIDDFVWSAGGAPSADAAESLWSADPLVLSELVRVLEGGCSERETGVLIVCPARADGGRTWRAELRRQGKAWRFAAFYQEE